MSDLTAYSSSHFNSYIEQWLDQGLWQKILTSKKSLILDIDQKRGKDGLISQVLKADESVHKLLIDLNGVTTVKEFIERFLTAYLQHPDTGLHSISKILVEAFMNFNPSIGLNPYTREAMIYFPEVNTDSEILAASAIQTLPVINAHWQKPLIFFVNNAEQLFEIRDAAASDFMVDFFNFLQDKYRIVYIIEDHGDSSILDSFVRMSKNNRISAPLPNTQAMVRYFTNFWNIEADTITHKNLISFLKLIDFDPMLAWHLNSLVFLHKENEDLSFNQYKDQLDQLLSLNHNLYRNIFNSLTNYQKRILKALAVTEGDKLTTKQVRNKFELNTSPYVIQGLEFLRKKRLIRKYDKRHLFVDPLFRIWVLKYS